MRDRIRGALASAGLLGDAAAFEYEALRTLQHSYVARIQLESEAGSGRRLVFKQSVAATDNSTLREARFYSRIADWLPPGAVPNCLAVEIEGTTTALLLEDLAPVFRPAAEGVPSFAEANAFIEALATIHAAAMQRPDIAGEWAAAFGDLPHSTIEGRLAWTLETCARFLAEAEGIDPLTRETISRIVAAGPAILGTALPRTIAHGDAHFWNALYADAGAVLLDWGNVCLGPPGIDLAHAVALNLPPGVRQEWEQILLAAYTQAMRRNGVEVDEPTVREWYRRGVLYALVVPAGLRAMGIDMPRLMANVSAAARELDVARLV
jgi:aminoglycoside phosphotransferase (APT) family kinase protein